MLACGFGHPVLPEASEIQMASATLRRHLAHITLSGILQPHVPERFDQCHTLVSAALAADLKSRLSTLSSADNDGRQWEGRPVSADGFVPPDVSPQ